RPLSPLRMPAPPTPSQPRTPDGTGTIAAPAPLQPPQPAQPGSKPVSASGLCTQNPPRSPARRNTRDRPRPADQRFLALQSSLAQTRHFGREALVASGRSGLGRPPPGAPLRRQPLPAPGSRRQSLASARR